MSGATSRPARRDDAPALARMANLLNRHEGLDDGVFSPAVVERDFFDDRPMCRALIAELDDAPVGYATYSEIYNSDLAMPGLWLGDLFVVEGARGQGVGRQLLAAVALAGKLNGAGSLWWGVLSRNEKARSFYVGLGARDMEARILELDGPALARLAAEAAHDA